MTNNDSTKKLGSVDDFINYFEWSKQDTYIYLPNEIFNDLNSVNEFEDRQLKFRHKAFAYSYYYLITYLYRNNKFVQIHPFSKLHSISLIECLGCSRKHYNFINKKYGLLDVIGYTFTQYDFPIDIIIEDDIVGFQMFSSLEEHVKKSMQVPPNFHCNVPLRAFKRKPDSINLDGTFYEVDNTHKHDFVVFAKCVMNEKYGVELFYLYGFLKAFNSLLNEKFLLRPSYFSKSLGMTPKRFKQLMKGLVDLKLIVVTDPISFKYRIL